MEEKEKQTGNPMISVVMPTYNTPVPLLSAAVDSILKQSYGDFEFIIIDDCSNDESVEYLATLQDTRVRVHRNEENMGITRSLNVGFSQAKGVYIARMDSDDICLPQRFEKQLAFMQANPEVIVCGTWIQAFGDADYCTKRVIPEREYLRCSFLFGNIWGLCHPTAFFRASLLKEKGIRYDENLPTAQDYGMWTSCADHGEIANVEQILLHYRVHAGQISVEKRQLQKRCAERVQGTLLQRVMPTATQEQVSEHVRLCQERQPTSQLRKWIKRLKRENKKSGAYPEAVFDRCAEDFLIRKFADHAKVARTPGQLLRLLSICPLAASKPVLKTLAGRILRKKV